MSSNGIRDRVAIVGMSCTPFREHFNLSRDDLMIDAADQVLASVGVTRQDIDAYWLGMAASGNIHPGRTSMFEPVHGSAPRFAGKNVANPIGAISSAALMLETVGLTREAAAIDAAVATAVRQNQVTADIGGKLGTREAGDFITHQLTNSSIHK